MERMRESYPARAQQWWNTFTISTPHESEEAHGFLGRVDELFNDNPRGNEMNKRQKGLAQFLIPRGNASKLFEVMKEPFYLLT